jgi:RHS repeat-associated protein
MTPSVLPQQIPTEVEAGRDAALRRPIGAPWQPCVVIFCALVLVMTTSLRAQIGNDNPTGTSGVFNGNVNTGCSYDPYTGNATRSVTDLAVAGAVGTYPLAFTRTMNTRYTPGAGTLEFGQAGTWRHNYQWSIDTISFQDSGPNRWYAMPGSYWVNYPDGRRVLLGTHQSGDPNLHAVSGVGDRFQPLTGVWGGDCYLLLSDGGKVWFSVDVQRDGDDFGPVTSTFTFTFMGIIDPYGQVTSVSYPGDGSMTITEPAGRWLKLFYITTPWNGDTVIDTVAASDGRSVKYNYGGYNTPNGTVYTFLGNIVYFGDSSILAIYSYQNDNVDPNGRPLIQWAIDPMYGGPMWAIGYTFVPGSSAGVYGQLQSENYLDPSNGQMGAAVSTLSVNGNSRTETRGDGPARTFNYSGGWLTSHTDFKGAPSSIGYDGYGYSGSFTDARGNTTSTSREPRIGAVSVLTHPGDNSTASFGYSDGNNPYYLVWRKDERDNYTYYDRDGSNRVWRIRYPNGSSETFSYTPFGQVVDHQLTSGAVEHSDYDGRGLKTQSYPSATESDPSPWNHPTHYHYYTSGPNLDRLEYVTDPLGNSTSFQYNARGQVTRVRHMDNSFVQIGYDNHGDRTSVTDELNHTTTFGYDDYKRVVSVANPINPPATFSYAQDWVNSYVQTSSNPKYAVSPMNKNVVYGYDENFRTAYQVAALGTGDDEAWTWYGYDAVGNLTSVQDPRGNVTTYGYDSRNCRTSATNPAPFSNQVTHWDYDVANNLRFETRPDTSHREIQYDSMNRAIDTYGFANEHTHYDRDATGNVWQMIDAKGASYHFGYDALNRKINETYPADAYGATRTEHFWYDAAGNLSQYKNPADQYRHFNYDNRNRRWDSWWDGGAGPTISTRFDDASRLSSVTTNGGETVVSFGYDDANRKVWEDQTLSGYPTRRVETPRDADGNRTALRVAGNYDISYAYTQRNQLANVAGLWYFSYDKNGNTTRREGRWYYTNPTNFEYDQLNRVVMGEQGANGWIYARSHYQYDALGRQVTTWRDEQGSKGEWFGYDTMNQLTTAIYNADQVYNGTPTNWDRRVDYSLDALNRQSVTDNGTVTTYSPSALNQYQSFNGTTYNYDYNFNLREAPNWGGVFDAQNRLTGAAHGGGVASLTYDGLGRCVRRTTSSGTTLYTYDGWNPMLEWDQSGNRTAWTIYGAGADEILARYDYTGPGPLLYKQDKSGNVVGLLDSAGNIIEKYTYDAFGQPTITDWWGNPHVNAGNEPQSWYGNRFMFQGREYISELGIYDYRNRFYHPGLGRFLQKDPLGLRGGDANLFRYCGGDPVNHSDPSGLSIVDWIKKFFTEDKNSGSGTATTPPVIVRGSLVETAESAGMGPRGPATALDYSPNDHGSNGGLSAMGEAARDWLADHHPELKPRQRDIQEGPVGRDLIGRPNISQINPFTKRITIDSSQVPSTADYVETLTHELMHANDSFLQNLLDWFYIGENHEQIYFKSREIGNEYRSDVGGDGSGG